MTVVRLGEGGDGRAESAVVEAGGAGTDAGGAVGVVFGGPDSEGGAGGGVDVEDGAGPAGAK